MSSPELSDPIKRYVAAENAGNADAVAACFGPKAVVKDEGTAFTGHAAIRQWKAETIRKYRHRIEPLAATGNAEKVSVACRVTGEFPGSSVELHFDFRLVGDRITRLEIRP
jgi:hypothetical protein